MENKKLNLKDPMVLSDLQLLGELFIKGFDFQFIKEQVEIQRNRDVSMGYIKQLFNHQVKVWGLFVKQTKNTQIIAQVQRYEHLLAESWKSFEASKETKKVMREAIKSHDIEEEEAERNPALREEGKIVQSKLNIMTDNNAGDPKILAIITMCLKEISKLLNLIGADVEINANINIAAFSGGGQVGSSLKTLSFEDLYRLKYGVLPQAHENPNNINTIELTPKEPQQINGTYLTAEEINAEYIEEEPTE